MSKNIYSLYEENNYRYGFFIKEGTWENSIGEVLFFTGVKEGDKLKGDPPYFINPRTYVKLYFISDLKELKNNTKYKIIKIGDGGSSRYKLVTPEYS
jgi:hypothetical protein